ncbi:helix-turn-helix domain-containing protein [Hoeflea sp.]|uniref:AraC family transcriptional regulator n=1 Tax=Hoeflea sp. TaxID=1940281 RepID=UPI003B010DFF
MNTHWFSSHAVGSTPEFVFESVEEDFEQQAAGYRELGVNYTQLSRGRFRGRMISALLGKISIYVEHCNQTMEKEITLPPDRFHICLALDETEPARRSNCGSLKDCVHMVPPDGKSLAVFPANSVLLVITVDRQSLLQSSGLVPQVADWLACLSVGGAVIDSARLAQRLRTDIISALEGAANATPHDKRAALNQATVLAVSSALTMEWLPLNTLKLCRSTHAYERFRTARSLLLNDAGEFGGQVGRPLKRLGSKRSIEQAFTDYVAMGPITYARVVRLHKARRKLLDRERLNESIGNIAAEEGFWDGSRFASYYRRHFGELPSETRDRSPTAR